MKKKTVVRTWPDFRFEAGANSFACWHVGAYELIASANVCYERYRRFFRRPDAATARPVPSVGVAMMLYAFGLEGLLKSLWLAQGNRATETKPDNTRRLTEYFRQHDLSLWWDRTKLPDLKNERRLLHFLTTMGEVGRYPVRARPQPERTVVTRDIKPDIVAQLTIVDREIRRLRPRIEQVSGPARLASIGIRTST